MPATDAVRQKFQAITDRFAAFQAQSLNVHVDFPLLQRLALPINIGTVRYPGIKIHDTRIIRLMEVLLHGSNTVGGSTARQIHQAVLAAFELSPNTYVLNQLRYDLRKLKGHGLLQRDGRRYAYRGVPVALLFLFFHKRLCGPLANSCFHHQPDPHHRPDSKLGGETMLPTVTGDDGAIALSRYWASDAQVNVQYTVGTSARTGQHSLWITTEAGQSNAGTYYVYDATPVITSISPGVWQAGASTPVTISGTGFGTTPTVSFSDSYVSWTQGTASDTSISGTATVNANDPGGTVTITVTSNGYGSGFQGGTGQAKQGSKNATVSPAPPPTLNVTVGGAPVSAGQCTFINASPAMPSLSANLVPAAGTTLSGNVSWQIKVQWAGPDSPPTSYSNLFPSTARTVVAGQPWNIASEFVSTIVGGTATIYYTYGNLPQQQFSFCIKGQNPSATSVKNQLGTSPWYIQQIARMESSYQQFDGSNNPLYGPPHGFGIMQIDPPISSQDVWSWTHNVVTGAGVVATKQSTGTSFWNNQVSQFQTWNQQNPQQQVAPPTNTTEANCVFSYSPVSPQKVYGDAIAIKLYNGAPSGNYIVWQNTGIYATNPFWQFHKTETSGSQTINYVNLVCSQIP